MKTKLFTAFLFFVVLLSCRRQEEPANDYGLIIFYKQSTGGSFSVYIDNVPWGSVPYVSRTPVCNSTEGLRVHLVPGIYWLDVRNNNSTVYKPPEQLIITRGECKLYRVQQ